MKKVLSILIFCATIGIFGASAVPEPARVPAIESIANSPAVRGGEGKIYLMAGSVDATFHIYSITGQLVRSVKVSADSHVVIEMPKGFYIVRYSNQWSRKVVVN